jgi:iron complex outermembrane receptor protein
MISRKAILLSCVGFATIATGSTAFSGSARAQTASAGVTEIEELVITAEKREQNLQDVAVAVSAFTAEKRDLIGITSIQDITNFTPGLAYSAGTDRISLRGIGRLTNNLASDPGVATYLDGVYSSFTVDAGQPPILIDRVEVLRGPQGTLYGRNSIGGAINVISKRPEKSFSGDFRVIAENYDHQEYQGRVSVPVSDDLRFSLAAIHVRQDKGWFHNLAGLGGEGGVANSYYVVGQMEANLGENVDVWLKAAQSQYKNRGAPGGRTGGSLGPLDPALITPGSLSPGVGYGFASGVNVQALGPLRNGAVFSTGDLDAFSANVPTTNHVAPDHNIQAQATWHGPGVDLKYIGGYHDYSYVLRSDFDNTALLSYQIPLNATALCRFVPGCQPLTIQPNVISVYQEKKKFWSNELNLSSAKDGPVQWIVGVYQYEEHYTQPVTITEPDVVALATPSGAPANPQRIIYYTNQTMGTITNAAFGQIDWNLTSQIKITGGLRYTLDKKKGTEEGRLFCYGCAATVDPRNLGTLTPVLDITTSTFSGVPPVGSTQAQKGVVGPAVTDPFTGIRRRGLADSWDAWTGTLGVEWKPDDDTLAYAKYSRGYKAGGFNSGTIAAFPETDAEHVDAYEAGLKRDWSPRLRTNVSAFWYDYKDAQVPVTQQPAAGPAISLFFNLPKIRNRGVELETTWIPIDNLTLLFNYSYLDARIREACCIQDGADPTGAAPGVKPGPNGNKAFQDLSGQRMPVSPKHKIALNGVYHIDLPYGGLDLSGSYTWRDKVYSTIFSRDYYLADSRGQLDARATWRAPGSKYVVIVYGRNLTNEEDFDTAGASLRADGTMNHTFSLVPPRTYGVELQYHF